MKEEASGFRLFSWVQGQGSGSLSVNTFESPFLPGAYSRWNRLTGLSSRWHQCHHTANAQWFPCFCRLPFLPLFFLIELVHWREFASGSDYLLSKKRYYLLDEQKGHETSPAMKRSERKEKSGFYLSMWRTKGLSDDYCLLCFFFICLFLLLPFASLICEF